MGGRKVRLEWLIRLTVGLMGFKWARRIWGRRAWFAKPKN